MMSYRIWIKTGTFLISKSILTNLPDHQIFHQRHSSDKELICFYSISTSLFGNMVWS